jgi:hypothetical protein
MTIITNDYDHIKEQFFKKFYGQVVACKSVEPVTFAKNTNAVLMVM